MSAGPSGFSIRPPARAALLAVLCLAVLVRAWGVVDALADGHEHALLAFPFAAIFPAVLVGLLATMPPARSREGLLMRIGAMVQLLLIVLVPWASLYLALGMPVVFLVVELFETRAPAALRRTITGLLVA